MSEEDRLATHIRDALGLPHEKPSWRLVFLFYNLFQCTPDFGASAGWIRANTSFMWKDYKATDGDKNSMLLQLTPSGEYPLGEETKLVVGHYYRPRADTFLAIDSLLLPSPPNESPIFLTFQMMRAKEYHGVSERGLNTIAELGLPSGTRKYFSSRTSQQTATYNSLHVTF